MSTAAQPRRPARWASIVLAPMIWLEKARGRKRLALLLLYAIVLAAIGVLIMRQMALSGLPDIGEPYDVAAFLQEQRGQGPESEQPYVFYEKAARKFQPYGLGGSLDPSSEPVRGWAEANREALFLWRQGTERTGPARRPGEFRLDLPMTHVPTNFVGLSRLALLEGNRLEAQGDFQGAWEWYRAVLRADRQLMTYGDVIDREASATITSLTAVRLKNWAAQPKVDAALLQQALQEALLLETHTPPPSRALKSEYLNIIHTLDDSRVIWFHRKRQSSEPTWYEEIPLYHAAKGFLRNEPERTRRAVKLLIANWLPESDKPFLARMGVRMVGAWPVYDDPEAPASAHVLPPEQLDRWMETVLLAQLIRPAHTFLGHALDLERRARGVMILDLAEQLYSRRYGAVPERPEGLVGVVLDQLPAGYDPEVPMPGPRPMLPSIGVEYQRPEPGLDLLGPGRRREP